MPPRRVVQRAAGLKRARIQKPPIRKPAGVKIGCAHDCSVHRPRTKLPSGATENAVGPMIRPGSAPISTTPQLLVNGPHRHRRRYGPGDRTRNTGPMACLKRGGLPETARDVWRNGVDGAQDVGR